MSDSQRRSLLSLMDAILACSCCPPDIRDRAQILDAFLRVGVDAAFRILFGARR